MRKYITTIVLVVIFLGLLAFFWFYESKREGKQEEDLLTKTFVVWDLNRDEIISLIFEYDDKMIEVIKKPDNNWEMTKPENAKVKTDKINDILDKLSKIEGKGEEIVYKNLADFGLEKPRAKVTLRFSNDNTKDIILGDENPEGTKIYAKVSDKNFVFLADKFLLNKLKVTEKDLKEN